MFDKIAIKFSDIIQPLRTDQDESRAKLNAYEYRKTEISTIAFIEINQRINTFRVETESDDEANESIKEISKSFVVESAS